MKMQTLTDKQASSGKPSGLTAINLIPDSLEYYDNNSEKYTDFFKRVKYVKFIDALKDMEHNNIYMFDNNKNEILKSRYEILGVYNNKSKTWTWAWSIPRFRKNSTHIARKIVNYGMDLDPESRFLKTELITSRFRITNPIQLDIHAAIASYLSKKYVVYKYISYISQFAGPKDVNGLIDITNIPEKYRDEYSIYYMFLLDYEKIV
ncbi:MAG: hypothetical protein Hyperionvirus20_13 [Hyperionvirus sp.]|uniref:Uncharacterized protein n=1 Tax=Hyperionvirus sp. TaxID=2487770 RepID=A0A3G5AAH8_9VIRU|nr:MAG: hypothetical protein Hyperionvirus20_13 [Hyperionvirus sp.]